MIAVELSKQLRRPRTWGVLAAVAGLSIVLSLVIGITRPATSERLGSWLSVTPNTSGFVMPLLVLNALMLFVFPLSAAIFAGESVAGEKAWGSLRYLLARPGRRSQTLAVKSVTAAALTVTAIVVALLCAAVIGVVISGPHSLTVVDLEHTTPFNLVGATFGPGQAIVRIGLATAFVVASVASTFAFALLLSTITSRPFSAVAGGIGLSLFSRALDNIAGLAALRPVLPITDSGTNVWTGVFTHPTQTQGMAHFFLIQALYTAAFLVASWRNFERADVLT